MGTFFRAPDWFSGNVRPTPKFWIGQYIFLAASVGGPMGLVALGVLIFTEKQYPAWLTVGAVLFVLTVPVVGLVHHARAVNRSGKLASSRTVRFFCKFYSPLVVLAPVGLVFLMCALNFRNFQIKARQSEAKIALDAIHGSERAYFSTYQKYSSDLDAIGYSPEGQRAFYTYAVVTCANGSRTKPTRISPKGLQGGDGVLEKLNSALEEWANKEACDSRTNSFAAFAAGTSRNSGSVDVWRIDESRRLTHLQEGD